MPPGDRYKTVHLNRRLNEGETTLRADPQHDVRVLAFVLTADETCRVRLRSGTDVQATFFVDARVPIVLPYNEEGWWIYPSGADHIAVVNTQATSVNVQLLMVQIREK